MIIGPLLVRLCRTPRRAVKGRRGAATIKYVARPPEMSNTAPVENAQSGEASQHTSDATSSTVPKRFIGIFDFMKSMCCCVICLKMSVSTAAGVTQLTQIFVVASSLPSDLVSPMTPALADE